MENKTSCRSKICTHCQWYNSEYVEKNKVSSSIEQIHWYFQWPLMTLNFGLKWKNVYKHNPRDNISLCPKNEDITCGGLWKIC